MTSEKALQKALEACRTQFTQARQSGKTNAGLLQGGQAQNVGHTNQQGYFPIVISTWAQQQARAAEVREMRKAENAAYNTRIANERVSREAAKNESPASPANLWIEAKAIATATRNPTPQETRKPTAPPAPKCAGSLKEHGPLVERWRKSLLGGSDKLMMCDACYIYAEKLMASDTAFDDEKARVRPTSPPARTGLVPQSFGDQRIGGVWAARGMR